MKTLILTLALAGLIALSYAKPPRGGGQSSGHGRGGGHRGGMHGKPCKIVFSNGTEVNNDCPGYGGLFVCEEFDLTQFDVRPRHFQDVNALFVCIPVGGVLCSLFRVTIMCIHPEYGFVPV